MPDTPDKDLEGALRNIFSEMTSLGRAGRDAAATVKDLSGSLTTVGGVDIASRFKDVSDNLQAVTTVMMSVQEQSKKTGGSILEFKGNMALAEVTINKAMETIKARFGEGSKIFELTSQAVLKMGDSLKVINWQAHIDGLKSSKEWILADTNARKEMVKEIEKQIKADEMSKEAKKALTLETERMARGLKDAADESKKLTASLMGIAAGVGGAAGGVAGFAVGLAKATGAGGTVPGMAIAAGAYISEQALIATVKYSEALNDVTTSLFQFQRAFGQSVGSRDMISASAVLGKMGEMLGKYGISIQDSMSAMNAWRSSGFEIRTKDDVEKMNVAFQYSTKTLGMSESAFTSLATYMKRFANEGPGNVMNTIEEMYESAGKVPGGMAEVSSSVLGLTQQFFDFNIGIRNTNEWFVRLSDTTGKYRMSVEAAKRDVADFIQGVAGADIGKRAFYSGMVYPGMKDALAGATRMRYGGELTEEQTGQVMKGAAKRMGIDYTNLTAMVGGKYVGTMTEEQRWKSIGLMEMMTGISGARFAKRAGLTVAKTQEEISAEHLEKAKEQVKILGDIRSGQKGQTDIFEAGKIAVGKAGGSFIEFLTGKKTAGKQAGGLVMAPNETEPEFLMNARATRENMGMLSRINQGMGARGAAAGGGVNVNVNMDLNVALLKRKISEWWEESLRMGSMAAEA